MVLLMPLSITTHTIHILRPLICKNHINVCTPHKFKTHSPRTESWRWVGNHQQFNCQYGDLSFSHRHNSLHLQISSVIRTPKICAQRDSQNGTDTEVSDLFKGAKTISDCVIGLLVRLTNHRYVLLRKTLPVSYYAPSISKRHILCEWQQTVAWKL